MSNWESLLPADTSANAQANQPSPFHSSVSSLWNAPEYQPQAQGQAPGLNEAYALQQFKATEAQVSRTGNLSLRYGDPNIDRELALDNYRSINIDLPAGVSLKHWVDQKGYFFWLQGGNDNNARHYYSPNAESLTVNGQNFNLEAQRLKIAEAYAGQSGGFQSLTGSNEPIKYFENMSHLGSGALTVLQNALQQQAYKSDNPYFKIYLADVYTAEAVQPIIQQMMTTGTASLNNPQTIGKLDQAIALCQQAEKDASNGISPYGDVPQVGSYMPLDPYEIYGGYGGGYGLYPNYYGFWGGSLDQARYREMSLSVLKNLIQSNVLPQIELPPALPAR